MLNLIFNEGDLENSSSHFELIENVIAQLIDYQKKKFKYLEFCFNDRANYQ